MDNTDGRDVLLGSPGRSTGIYDYLPKSDHGVILFTTQSLAGTATIDLHEMTHDLAEEFLKKSLLRYPHQDSHAVAQLLQDLTYLPLAIRQATAFMNKNRISIAKYLELFRLTEQDKVELLSSNFDDRTRYKDSQHPVATTWLVSFEKIHSDNPQDAQLLEFLA